MSQWSGGEIGPFWSGNIFVSTLNWFCFKKMTRQGIVHYLGFSEPPLCRVSFCSNTNSPKASVLQEKSTDSPHGNVGKRDHRVRGSVLCLLTPLYLPWTPWSCSGVQRAESSILPALHKHIRDGTRGRGEERKGPILTDRQGSIDSQTTIINSTLLSSVWCVAQGQVENLSVAASSTNRFPLIFQ